MPSPDPADRLHDAARAHLAAAALSSAAILDAWSRTLALAALLWPALAGPGGGVLGALMLSLCAAAVQCFWAWRTRLDAAIFAGWASAWRRPSGPPVDEDLQRFDRALADWSASHAAAGVHRPLAARLRGTRRLLLMQAICLATQAAALLTAVLLVATDPAA